ncbi:hypothetical protein C7999DRAFT_29717 [Corynascus novoguineensis]|uniref:Uncharacterized protein n=1 Tax=Corynascus novoguineensis TaxID=1126955 RepID=A0AAN7CZK4_9PEZI|nr:hypothetical protein C7999DRAFT_29717 [Corynascus novoguineensis]
MCYWSYAHHHHLPPCTQPIEMVVNYNYCENAVVDPVTGEAQPCKYTYFGDDAAMINQVDYDDPCATGGCLISPSCESGECRLAQLGGRWACCRCGGRANEYRWCQHRLRASPDTFCYHVCCEACTPDHDPPPPAPSQDAGGGSSSSAAASAAASSSSSSSKRRGKR